MCRTKWEQPAANANAGPSYSAEGYLNLGAAANLPTQRDTSSCAPAPVVASDLANSTLFEQTTLDLNAARGGTVGTAATAGGERWRGVEEGFDVGWIDATMVRLLAECTIVCDRCQ